MNDPHLRAMGKHALQVSALVMVALVGLFFGAFGGIRLALGRTDFISNAMFTLSGPLVVGAVAYGFYIVKKRLK